MASRNAHEHRARERAREVQAEFSIHEWPLIPEQIATAAQLPIEERSGFPPNTYGAFFKAGNAFKIMISANCHTEGQRRFTLCHELGHYFLDGHVDVLFENGAEAHLSDTNHFRGTKLWYEVEADAFAAELLVPSSIARPVMTEAGAGLAAVRAIANAFGVSWSCAAVRFANLTNDPAVVMLSCGREIEWVSWSSPMRSHAFARRRVKGEWVPPRSVTNAFAHSPERVLAHDVAESNGLLAEWFNGAPAVEVTEEVAGLGQYGRTLTVLTCAQLPSVEVYEATQEREMTRERDWRDALRPWQWDRYEDVDDE